MSEDIFKQAVMSNKIVSVWGVGYLGYTTLLILQKSGFSATIYDFDESRLQGILDKTYPNREQLNSWTKYGKVPKPDLNYLKIANEPKSLFESRVHIISFPNSGDTNYALLAKQFIQNRNKLKNSLIIFQSAGVPNDIELNFCRTLLKSNIRINVTTVFRSDWTIEELTNKTNQRIVSANNNVSLKRLEIFLELLNLSPTYIGSVKEAEVYENAKNALDYTVTAFFNQLSLSYPGIDMNNIAKNILNKFDHSNASLGVNGVDYKSEQSIDNLVAGGSGNDLLILKEANNTNISFLYYYVDLLKSKGINSITMFGLSSYNNLKDFRFSPSILLAEHLNKEGIKIYVHDDNFTEDELLKILPFSEFININIQSIKTDVVLIMSLSSSYVFLTQEDIKNMGLYKVKYIIDNTGFFKNYTYDKDVTYHHLCDGNLTGILNL
jgi:UDP-N-acetyl-D-mannosaminuronate dehydrogenase